MTSSVIIYPNEKLRGCWNQMTQNWWPVSRNFGCWISDFVISFAWIFHLLWTCDHHWRKHPGNCWQGSFYYCYPGRYYWLKKFCYSHASQICKGLLSQRRAGNGNISEKRRLAFNKLHMKAVLTLFQSSILIIQSIISMMINPKSL